MTGRPLCLGLLIILPLAAVADTQPTAPAKPEGQGPLTAEQSLPLFRVAPGLRVELVAAEPDVQSPVAMTFDEDGRLWVIEMLDYPNGPAPGKPPEGRIRLLEDRDSSGRYKATGVFAGELLFANGALPWRGGLLVTSAPNILYLKDTNGDGKADVRQKLYEGFAVENPQLRVSHPNLGIDNWVYVANGLRGGKVRRSGEPDARVIDISGRDFRFDPVDHRAEAVTGMGQFGNTFDDWGQRFVCSNRNQWVHMVLPEHYVRRNPFLAVPPPHRDNQGPGGAARVYPISKQRTTAAEHAGHFTAACSVFVYRGDLLPEQYRGSVFTCEPTGNLVHQEILLPKGATFTGRPARPGVEFLATTDGWCRPVFLTTGPDAALYFVDMYRKEVEHPQFRKSLQNNPDVLLGKDRGRIWRIVPDGYKGPRPRPQLGKATTPELVALLGDANAWRRTTAQRLLLGRQDPQADAPLRKLVASSPQPLARVHAAWLLEQRGKLTPDLVLDLLRHDHPRVREHGVRLSERWLARSPALQQRLVELARDQDARLRFQVALSLGEWDDDGILQPLADVAVAGVDDPWTRLAVASALPTRAGALLAVLLRPAQGLTKQVTPDALQLVQELSALVGGRQEPREVADLLETVLALSGKEAGTWQMAARKGLAEGALRRGTQLSALLQKLPPERRGLLAKMDTLMSKTVALARDGKGAAPERVEAVRQLAHIDWKTAAPVLTRLLAEEPAEAVRVAAVRAAAAFPGKEVPALIVQPWAGYPAGAKREALEALLSNPERTLVLLGEVEAGRISATELDALRRLQLLNHRRSDVRDRARKIFEASPSPERRTILEKYRPALKLAGDAGRGRQVFQKATCASCHRVNGVGVDVGPTLADVRSRAPEALLVDILDPNAAIDANYVSYLVSLKTGKLLTGLIAAETASSIVLRRAEQQSDTLLRQDIESDGVVSTGKSLMPEGLEKGLSVQEMADLLAFLRGDIHHKDTKGTKEDT